MSLEAFTPGNSYKTKNFNCGVPAIDTFARNSNFKQQAKNNIARTFLFLNPDRVVLAFYTLQAFSIASGDLLSAIPGNQRPTGVPNCSLPTLLPMLRIGMLGVDQSLKNKGIGSNLIAHATSQARSAREFIGHMGIYVQSEPSAIGFYKKNSFEELITPNLQTSPETPMFLTV